MENLGLVVNTKKIMRALILLVAGLSLMFYGIIGYFADYVSTHQRIADTEIIERAKELGMVEPRDIILDEQEQLK
ncbi:hypothetical protein KHM83_15925 [Fusibacter paucivorans]|uniref:Uncharacterized protein n=1 Tax=Fusibacter paucivorans TaxID=76009 RepID=A0ABS5PSW3_9FIRM|nr:hypothetical protein [Fusibacter paucivorans]MBS7528176.1 hypothetical protein [Fusibacter paucivorans]